MRAERTLDDGWRFASGDIGIDAAISGDGPFEPVTLPHTWNPPSPDGEPTEAEEIGWYRRDLSVDDAGDGRRVVVEFGAVARVADVYVGTTHVGQHEGGYSIFRVDVTDALDATGAGALSVRVDNETGDTVYPLLGDHTFFGGITRSVKLITCDPVHIDLADHGSPGVFLSQRELDDARGIVAARVRVANNGKAVANPTVRVEAFDADGASVATASAATSVGPGEVTETDVTLTVDSPRRWDGRNDPHLYRLVTELDDGADNVELPFGLRTFHADPDQGSFLNGRPYRLHGVSRHYDVGQRGAAMTRADNDHDLELLNELGVTAVRLSHYQHDQYMYDLCDRAGIAVWAEIPYNALTSGVDPAGNAVSQMTELIRQSAHHPSIVCWGVQNEITLGQASNDPRPVIRELHQLVHDEDPTRPSAQANMPQAGFDDDIHTLTDLDALNTYCGWYYGEAAEVGAVLDEHHEANPGRPFALSEYGADAYVGYHSTDPAPGDYTEEYQAVLHEVYWKAIEARPWLWGSFVWNGFDFSSDLRAEGGQRGRNMKGLVDHDRAVRKDAFHWYKANWSDVPFVHITSKRFRHRHDPHVTVKVYSNRPEVRLEVDGVDAGGQTSDDHIFTWDMTLDPGVTTVRAVAEGADGTDETIEDVAEVELVAEPDGSYVCPQPAVWGGMDSPIGKVKNWYEDEGITADPEIYSTWTLLGDLLDDPRTRAVLEEVAGPDLLDHPQIEIARNFTLDQMAQFAPDQIDADTLRSLHDRLSVIPKP